MCKRIFKSLAMLGLPSIGLGFFPGNRLDMVFVSVLACSDILGIFLGRHCSEKCSIIRNADGNVGF